MPGTGKLDDQQASNRQSSNEAKYAYFPVAAHFGEHVCISSSCTYKISKRCFHSTSENNALARVWGLPNNGQL